MRSYRKKTQRNNSSRRTRHNIRTHRARRTHRTRRTRRNIRTHRARRTRRTRRTKRVNVQSGGMEGSSGEGVAGGTAGGHPPTEGPESYFNGKFEVTDGGLKGKFKKKRNVTLNFSQALFLGGEIPDDLIDKEFMIYEGDGLNRGVFIGIFTIIGDEKAFVLYKNKPGGKAYPVLSDLSFDKQTGTVTFITESLKAKSDNSKFIIRATLLKSLTQEKLLDSRLSELIKGQEVREYQEGDVIIDNDTLKGLLLEKVKTVPGKDIHQLALELLNDYVSHCGGPEKFHADDCYVYVGQLHQYPYLTIRQLFKQSKTIGDTVEKNKINSELIEARNKLLREGKDIPSIMNTKMNFKYIDDMVVAEESDEVLMRLREELEEARPHFIDNMLAAEEEAAE